MNEDGQLVLKWYEQTAVTVTMNERYTSDLLENDITITGFTCDVSDEATYLAGTNEYALDLSGCGFLTNSYDGVLRELLAARGGFSYRPYSATIKSAPYLFPMDMIRYKDKDGAFHNTIVTNITFSLNCNTSISGAGETVTSYSYAQSASGVTSQQAATDRANLEKINQTATQTNQTKNDLTQFKTKYSSDFEKTQAAIESSVTKETYQTDMAGVSTRIGAAETKISQNADAITLRATKEELYSMITFTPENGLVITRSGWEGKVQITGQNVQVIRGNNKVTINDNGISITDGYGSCAINSGQITFHGIRNTKIAEITNAGTHSYGGVWFGFDLSNYSSIVLTYESYTDDSWWSRDDATGYVSAVLPVNGETFTIAMPWNTPHFRNVRVQKNGIQFGVGRQRTSNYNLGLIKSFDLETPWTSGWRSNDRVCVPKSIYGLM